MLNGIEKDIADWFVRNYEYDSDALREQFSMARVTDREFTAGGGVFISFNLESSASAIQAEPEVAQLDGPLIQSAELSQGASVGLGVSKKGYIEYFEIWAHGNDYPKSTHVKEYKLLEQGASLC